MLLNYLRQNRPIYSATESLADLRPHEGCIADAVPMAPLWNSMLNERPWKEDYGSRYIGKLNLQMRKNDLGLCCSETSQSIIIGLESLSVKMRGGQFGMKPWQLLYRLIPNIMPIFAWCDPMNFADPQEYICLYHKVLGVWLPKWNWLFSESWLIQQAISLLLLFQHLVSAD